MGLYTQKKDGREYFYYKMSASETLYLGTENKPNENNLERAYKHFLTQKARVLADDQAFERLRKAVKKP